MKRVVLFLATNLAVMLVLSLVTSLLGVNKFLTANGLNMGMLLAFAAVIGFGGSLISLMMSKMMAKWSTGARVIESPSNSTEVWLVDTVGRLAQRAGLPMPEVAIYEGEPNAFATGASKNSSLVAVSTGLLQSMTREEAEAVLWAAEGTGKSFAQKAAILHQDEHACRLARRRVARRQG